MPIKCQMTLKMQNTLKWLKITSWGINMNANVNFSFSLYKVAFKGCPLHGNFNAAT